MGQFLSTYSTELGVGAAAALVAVQLLTPANPIGSTLRLFSHFRKQEKALTSSAKVSKSIDEYNRLHSFDDSTERVAEYKSLVNSYYDLATLFYEWGWGKSFHFANRFSYETFDESIRRHEFYLASKLGLSEDVSTSGTAGGKCKVLDVGCGIGGPMRNICRFTGADVTGITLNSYQVQRGNELCDQEFGHRIRDGRSEQLPCRSVQGDFMHMPFKEDTFDAAYAIEATCHAPDRVGVYGEIFRVLKPGSIFACYEWCMTDAYDPKNADHRRMKKQIEEGDGLPDICHTSVCLDAMERAGFEVLDERDLAEEDVAMGTAMGLTKGKPWYLPLCPSWNPFTQRFQFNWLGLILTKYVLKVMEFAFLAPKGTSKTQMMLQKGAIGLADGGKAKIFTPMYLMVGRVPLTKGKVEPTEEQ